MSYRIHVVGARGATEPEFLAALESVVGAGQSGARFRLGVSGRWRWAAASVWHVDGGQLDQALAALAVPSLRVTSADGVLWMLTVTRPGAEPFRGVHHFTAVGPERMDDAEEQQEESDDDFPDDELDEVAGINRNIPELEFLWDAEEEQRIKADYAAERAATVPGLDDYTSYGATLSAETIAAMRNEPRRAWRLALEAHAAQIVEALVACGLEFDQRAMLELLTTGPLTPREQDSDLGNMPRFLELLGIRDVFANEEHEVPEVGDREPEDSLDEEGDQGEEIDEVGGSGRDIDWTSHPPGALMASFDALLDSCPLAVLADGPVTVSHPAVVHLLSHLLADDPPLLVSVEFSEASNSPHSDWARLDALEVRRIGLRWQWATRTDWLWRHVTDRKELSTYAVTRLLGELPDGTAVELACLTDALAERYHRFAGTMHAGGLVIERSYPPVATGVLREALSLVESTLDRGAIPLLSDEEVDRVRFVYQRSQGEPARIRNGKIKPEEDGRLVVVQTLLLERFPHGPWDVAGARQRIEDDWLQFQAICESNLGDDEDDDDLDFEQDDGASDSDDDQLSQSLSNLESMLERLQEATASWQESKQVPRTDEVVYEGKTGQFFRSSLSSLSHVSGVATDEHDATLASFGLQPIGDFVGEVDQQQEITRCYAGHPEVVALLSHRRENNLLGWAEVSDGMVSVDFSHGTREFHTHFEDGSTLATTSVGSVASKPELGIFIRSYEQAPTQKLWEKHLDGIARMRSQRGAAPIDHRELRSPAAFLAVMDRLFSRLLGLG